MILKEDVECVRTFACIDDPNFTCPDKRLDPAFQDALEECKSSVAVVLSNDFDELGTISNCTVDTSLDTRVCILQEIIRFNDIRVMYTHLRSWKDRCVRVWHCLLQFEGSVLFWGLSDSAT